MVLPSHVVLRLHVKTKERAFSQELDCHGPLSLAKTSKDKSANTIPIFYRRVAGSRPQLCRCDFIAPYVSLALPQVKSLILKAVYKYIRIYLYGIDPIFKRKTTYSLLTQPSYDRQNENRNRQTNNLSVAKNAKENLGVTSFFTTSPAYGLSQQVIYLTLFHL